MFRVFDKLQKEINRPSIYQLIKHLNTDINNRKGLTFDQFIEQATDFFNDRQTLDGIEHIFLLFDNQNKGYLTKDDLRRVSNELDLYLTSE